MGINFDQCLKSGPRLDPDERGAPSPGEDLASQPAPKNTSTIEERQHGWPAPRLELPLEHVHCRPGHNVPPANVRTFPKRLFLITLPRPGGAQSASEMITVSVRRPAALVAGAWHLERNY
jgi:hypothetical protein